MGNRIVTWSMTSRDLERSRSWPQYVYGPISRNRLYIVSRLQWSTYRKCYMGYQMVTFPMTSCDPKRSRSWSRYIWSRISRKRLRIEARFEWCTNRKPHMENRIVTWPWKVKVVTPYVWGPLSRKRLEIRIQIRWRTYRKWYMCIKWSHARWRQVTLQVLNNYADFDHNWAAWWSSREKRCKFTSLWLSLHLCEL